MRTVYVLVIASLLSAGCVRRQLTIRTEPPGATVFINEEKLGVTPYSFDFVWYGRYRISLKRDGYERLDADELIKAPWYLWIPVDLASELAPWEIHDNKLLSYTLAPKEAPALPVPPPQTKPEPAPAATPPPASTEVSHDEAR